jgi:hypothetical protein
MYNYEGELPNSPKQPFTVRVKYTFDVEFKINATSKTEARELINTQCGLTLGGNIHSTLADEDIDWEAGTHPETKIVSIKD